MKTGNVDFTWFLLAKSSWGRAVIFLKAMNINNVPAKHRHWCALITTWREITCPAFGLALSVPIQSSCVGIALQVLNDRWQSGARGRREHSQIEALHLTSCLRRKGCVWGDRNPIFPPKKQNSLCLCKTAMAAKLSLSKGWKMWGKKVLLDDSAL